MSYASLMVYVNVDRVSKQLVGVAASPPDQFASCHAALGQLARWASDRPPAKYRKGILNGGQIHKGMLPQQPFRQYVRMWPVRSGNGSRRLQSLVSGEVQVPPGPLLRRSLAWP